MPHIDLDALLDAMDGWDLSLSIDGNQFIVNPPPNASRELLETIIIGDSITQADRPQLENLIIPLILEPTVDVKKWRFDQLVGVATAVAIHAKEIYMAHSRNICHGVASVMRPGQPPKLPPGMSGIIRAVNSELSASRPPNIPAAAVSEAPGGSYAKSSPHARRLSRPAREAIVSFIVSVTGSAVPPGTSDADLYKLAANVSEELDAPHAQSPNAAAVPMGAAPGGNEAKGGR
jgi:hypothetical protein